MCNCGKHDGAEAGVALAEAVTFEVKDMTCGHCAGRIRTSLETALPGAEVAIDVASRRVTVAGDAAAAAAAITAAGYTPQHAAH